MSLLQTGLAFMEGVGALQGLDLDVLVCTNEALGHNLGSLTQREDIVGQCGGGDQRNEGQGERGEGGEAHFGLCKMWMNFNECTEE